jgi:hypothetical protein
MPRVPPARQSDAESHRRWARGTLAVLGILLLASGMVISGGWPLMLFGFAAVVAAATVR